MVLDTVTFPTLFLDPQRCKRNINRMAERASNHDVIFRPHFKTHQSAEVGELFKDVGVERITVSSLRMAEYFADHGWSDILVAFPVNLRATALINELAQRIKLTLLVEDARVIAELGKNIDTPVAVYIKIDVGSGRTGLDWQSVDSIDHCLEVLANHGRLTFKGFLAHAGQTYSARGQSAVQAIYLETTDRLNTLKERYISQYPDLIISYGDTPSCSLARAFESIDEMRPGNFVFYDLMQAQIGSCNLDDIAVALACPVVAVHPERREVIVHGGAIHFAKDALVQNHRQIYGLAVEHTEQDWQVTSDVQGQLVRLSQEHGVVAVSEEWSRSVRPGQVMTFLPVHSCMTAQSMGHYRMTTGEYIDHFAGRGLVGSH